MASNYDVICLLENYGCTMTTTKCYSSYKNYSIERLRGYISGVVHILIESYDNPLQLQPYKLSLNQGSWHLLAWKFISLSWLVEIGMYTRPKQH